MNPSKKSLHLEQPSRCLSDDIISCDSEEEEPSFKLSTGSVPDHCEVVIPGKGTSTTSSSSSNLPPSNRRGLVHSVSIIVEPALSFEGGATGGDTDSCCSAGSGEFTEADLHSISHAAPTERRKTIAGPIVVLEDFYFGKGKYVYFCVFYS